MVREPFRNYHLGLQYIIQYILQNREAGQTQRSDWGLGVLGRCHFPVPRHSVELWTGLVRNHVSVRYCASFVRPQTTSVPSPGK